MAIWDGESPVQVGDELAVYRLNNGNIVERATVLYISDAYVIVINQRNNSEVLLRPQQIEFRVVLTPRDEGIENMTEITGKQAQPFLEVFGLLWDAGYRVND